MMFLKVRIDVLFFPNKLEQTVANHEWLRNLPKLIKDIHKTLLDGDLNSIGSDSLTVYSFVVIQRKLILQISSVY